MRAPDTRTEHLGLPELVQRPNKVPGAKARAQDQIRCGVGKDLALEKAEAACLSQGIEVAKARFGLRYAV